MLAVRGRPLLPHGSLILQTRIKRPGEGGGGDGTPLCKPYKYVPLQRVWFLGLFGLKTGIHFAHFGLESGMVFERTKGAYDRSDRFNSK